MKLSVLSFLDTSFIFILFKILFKIQKYLLKEMSNSMDNWPLEAVNRLLLKLVNHKPVGINRHFNMVIV